MPLPTLPAGYEQQAFEVLRQNLPGQWFQSVCTPESQIYPLLRGVALALAHYRYSQEQALDASIPNTSEGAWLSLHLQSIGLQRRSGETDPNARLRYAQEFAQTKNTRSGLQRAIETLTGLESPQIRLENDRGLDRFGEFRVVIDAKTIPWDEVDIGFLGEFLRNFVSNGIVPSIRSELQCLLYQDLGHWRFSDGFPPFNLFGPIWQRRNFISEFSLFNSRNLIAQMSAAEWATSRDRLEGIFQNGRLDSPGAFFLYLSDEGECPYLNANYSIALTPGDAENAVPQIDFIVDGFRFSDQLPGYLPIAGANLQAPAFTGSVPVLTTLPVLSVALPQLMVSIVGGGSGQEALVYEGRDFTRWTIESITETPPTVPASPQLSLMQTGPWTLVLTPGDPAWGSVPPIGTTLTGTPIATLNPSSIWWTDSDGDIVDTAPIWDADDQAVYMAAEFLLPSGTSQTIREIELRLNGVRVEYRRFSVVIPEHVNLGVLFKVKGQTI